MTPVHIDGLKSKDVKKYKYDYYKPQDDDSLIMDYGSYQCRVAWASQYAKNPKHTSVIEFENYLVKHQSNTYSFNSFVSSNTSGPSATNVGPTSIQRSSWDHGLPCNLDAFELQLEGLFSYFKLNESDYKSKRFVLSEPIMNPKNLRQNWIELLLEGYQFQSMSLFNDSLASYVHTSKTASTFSPGPKLLVNMGHSNCTVIPLIVNTDGKKTVVREGVRRMPIGAQKLHEYFLKSLQIKYRSFPTRMSSTEARLVFEETAHVVLNYRNTMETFMADPKGFEKITQRIQYPIPKHVLEADLETTPPEKNEEQKAEKKRLFKERMRQVADKRKQDRLATIETDLAQLQRMKEDMEELEGDETDEIDRQIIELTLKKNKILGIEDDLSTTAQTNYNWQIIDIPDSELTDKERMEKRKLKLIAANQQAREKKRQEQEALLQQLSLQEERDREWRERDLSGWLNSKYQARRNVLQAIEILERNKGRKSDFYQKRMKRLSALLPFDSEDESDNDQSTSKKKKKLKSISKSFSKKRINTEFGDAPEDWQNYQEEQDPQDRLDELENKLSELETLLQTYDPNYEETLMEQDPVLRDPLYQLFHIFQHGRCYESNISATDSLSTLQEAYQLALNVERFKVPEILFQPHIVGADFIGLSDLIHYCSSFINQNIDQNTNIYTSDSLPNDFEIYLTGGLSHMKGLTERLEQDLRMLWSVDQYLHITRCSDLLSPWKGAAAYYNQGFDIMSSKRSTSAAAHAKFPSIDRELYQEYGYDALIDKFQSDLFIL